MNDGHDSEEVDYSIDEYEDGHNDGDDYDEDDVYGYEFIDD